MAENPNNFINLPDKSNNLGKILDRLRIAQLIGKLHLDKLDTKKLILVISVCLAIIVYADLAFLARIQFNMLKEIKPKIVKMQKDLDVLDKGLFIMRNLKDRQREVLSKSKKIISEEQIDNTLQDLSTIAKADNVNIMQMQPSREVLGKQAKNQPAPRFIPILINLDLLCDYHHLGKFINDLENSDVLFGLESMTVTSQPNNYFIQKVNIVLKTYVKK